MENQIIENKKMYKEIISNPKYFKDLIISWSTKRNIQTDKIEKPLNTDLGIVTMHAYRIMPGQINTDGKLETLKVINPCGILETELTVEEIIEYGGIIHTAKKVQNKYN